ncbi:hypothetical protein THAOC_06551 [Thalassiosira oceanica]|uniref:Uncharacterized protein n=1 Tax=Thalassiosira oceanica TaxID=159749 RepID=K0T478_THAOC|nr:hypothetical protein THAOC_06551 [Thalassiosira oceanica]|eukprot:EJK71959.1 hypothetical protein THAOC_06551 [Thalassiosira oceanica]
MRSTQLLTLSSLATGSLAFVRHRNWNCSIKSRRTRRTVTIIGSPLPSSPLFSPEPDENDSGDDFGGFNPFAPGSRIPTKGGFGVLADSERKRPPPTTPGGQVSPRAMRMKELTTKLLSVLSDDSAVEELLRENADFLLDQLDNVDAALEVDSVYTPDMTRGERYGKYREVMDLRIEGARAPAAKKALGALRDFVLSQE